MSEKKTFILIGHKKRQGKDAFAQFLKNHLDNAEIISFAAPFKEIIADMYNISVEELDELKNSSPEWRKRLQRFGSGKMKEYFGETVWRDVLMNVAKKSDAKYIIIPDFRFKSEHIDGSHTVKVIRDESVSDDHISEVDLNDFEFDDIIRNGLDLAELDKYAKIYAEGITNGG